MRSPVPSLALEVDVLRRTVRVDGLPIDLTAPEFGILAALAREPGTVVSRRALLDTVFGPGFVDDDLVDLHVAKLREKLGSGAGQGFIETVGAIGYRLASND
jgi:DNA-binding response OmpR family regulator